MDESVNERVEQARVIPVKQRVHEFVTAASVERSKKDSLEQTKEWVDSVIDGAKDKAFREEVQKMYDVPEVKQSVKELFECSQRVWDLRRGGLSNKIFSIFMKTFKNLSSRPIEVTNTESGRGVRVVCGKQGFAVRFNVQSSQISNYDHLNRFVFAQKDEIAKNMLEHRSLRKWRPYFLKFCDIVPDVSFFEGNIVVHLEKPIILPERRFHLDKPPLADKCVIDGTNMHFRGVDEDERISYTLSDDDFGEKMGGRDALVLVQLYEHIPKIARDFKAIAEPEIRKANDAVAKLESEFGRFILLNDV